MNKKKSLKKKKKLEKLYNNFRHVLFLINKVLKHV